MQLAITFISTHFRNASEEMQIPLPLPRRNSIDLSKEEPKENVAEGSKYENQVSDYTHRR